MKKSKIMLGLVFVLSVVVSSIITKPSKVEATVGSPYVMQKVQYDKVVEVSNYTALKSAFTNANKDSYTCIRLTKDIKEVIQENGTFYPVNVYGKKILLDLNGYDISVDAKCGGERLFRVSGVNTDFRIVSKDEAFIVFNNHGKSSTGFTSVIFLEDKCNFATYGNFEVILGDVKGDDISFVDLDDTDSATLYSIGAINIELGNRTQSDKSSWVNNFYKSSVSGTKTTIESKGNAIRITNLNDSGIINVFDASLRSYGTSVSLPYYVAKNKFKIYNLQAYIIDAQKTGCYNSSKIFEVSNNKDPYVYWKDILATNPYTSEVCGYNYNVDDGYAANIKFYSSESARDNNSVSQNNPGRNDKELRIDLYNYSIALYLKLIGRENSSEYFIANPTESVLLVLPDCHYVVNNVFLNTNRNITQTLGVSHTITEKITSIEDYDKTGTKECTCSVCGYKTIVEIPKKARPAHTITFDATGGAVDPTSGITDDNGKIKLPIPTRGGFVFDGWYTMKTDGVQVTSSKVWEPSDPENVTIYAHWTKKAESELTSIESFTVTGIEDKIYTGSAITQKITVTDAKSKALVENTDYTVAYKNNVEAGEATVTITGTGDYKGTITKTFKITKTAVTTQPATTTTAPATTTTAPTEEVTVKGVTLKKLVKGKKSLVVKWNKNADADGYEIQYATSKNFKKNAKTVTIKKNKTVSKTIKKLKSGKKYYVRVRAYKTVNDEVKYSKWSKAKSAKTK